MQLEPHGSASAGTSSFAIQAHCFVRAIEHLRKVQLHVLPERVQRLGGLDGRTLSRIWICIKHAQKNCNHLILNSSIIACLLFLLFLLGKMVGIMGIKSESKGNRAKETRRFNGEFENIFYLVRQFAANFTHYVSLVPLKWGTVGGDGRGEEEGHDVPWKKELEERWSGSNGWIGM